VLDRLRTFQVNASEYFDGLKARNAFFAKSREMVQEPMTQLIQWLKINNKRVLSVGAGFGHEEYWFHNNDCSLTMVDLDSSHEIESYLVSLPEYYGTDCLTYHIEGIEQFVRVPPSKPFDVCYLSSLAPEELRRNDILKGQNVGLRRLKYRLGIPVWPKTEKPYSEFIEKLARFLANGGLFVAQFYATIARVEPRFISASARQLRTVGVELLDLYCYTKWPNVSLTIGYKGSRGEAMSFAKSLQQQEITSFHGRAEVAEKEIVKVFDLKQER
jgi:hypothetical protein